MASEAKVKTCKLCNKVIRKSGLGVSWVLGRPTVTRHNLRRRLEDCQTPRRETSKDPQETSKDRWGTSKGPLDSP